MAGSNDYQLLSSMVNGGGAQQVHQNPERMLSDRSKRTVQVNPYEGDHYSYGQNGGEHLFVDYGGLYQERPELQSSPTAAANVPGPGSVQGMPEISNATAPQFYASTPAPQPQPVQPTRSQQQSAQLDQLLTALQRPSNLPGAPTYFDLMTSKKKPILPTTIQERMDPFYGMAGWNQGGN